MKHNALRAFALTALIGFGSSTLGCGYILYPERRGNNGGAIDGATLVMDLLWLIPGILPGVIFLIVDFSSGAMYVKGGSRVIVTAEGNLTVPLEDSEEAKTLELRVVTGSQRVLDRKTTTIGPSVRDRAVELKVGRAVFERGEPLYVQVFDTSAPTALVESFQTL